MAHLSASSFPKDESKVEKLVYVYSEDGDIVEESKPFQVHFLKPYGGLGMNL